MDRYGILLYTAYTFLSENNREKNYIFRCLQTIIHFVIFISVGTRGGSGGQLFQGGRGMTKRYFRNTLPIVLWGKCMQVTFMKNIITEHFNHFLTCLEPRGGRGNRKVPDGPLLALFIFYNKTFQILIVFFFLLTLFRIIKLLRLPIFPYYIISKNRFQILIDLRQFLVEAFF